VQCGAAALALHLAVVVVEERVIDCEFLPAPTSRIATSTMLPAKPTLGSQEWLMNSITASYSSGDSATRCSSSAI
jgi:hypothetical protein